MAKPEKDIDVNRLIRKAVKQALEAGIAEGKARAEKIARAVTDPYKSTEKRLYALPVLIKRVGNSEEYLAILEESAMQGRSKDIVRFSTSSTVSAEDKLEALINDGKAKLAADEHEIATIKKALENIEDDPYYAVVKGRYFDQISDEEIAKQIPCDDSTVRRQRGRLVRIVAIWLYGAEAV